MPSTIGWLGIGAPFSSNRRTSSVPAGSAASGSAAPAVAPSANVRWSLPPAAAGPRRFAAPAPPPRPPATPEINIVRRPPTGGIVNVSVFSRSPSTVTSAWNWSPGDMPSNSARPVSSVFRARLRRSPPAFLMMALTSVSATAFAGSLAPDTHADGAGRHPAIGQRPPDDLGQIRHPAATAAAHHRLGAAPPARPAADVARMTRRFIPSRRMTCRTWRPGRWGCCRPGRSGARRRTAPWRSSRLRPGASLETSLTGSSSRSFSSFSISPR